MASNLETRLLHCLDQFTELFDRERIRPAKLDYPLFGFLECSGNLRYCRRNLDRHVENSMTVAVQQRSWTYLHSADLHGCTHIEYVGVSVRDENASGEQLDSSGAYGRQFADGPICDVADATQCFENGGMHVSDKSAPAGRDIGVFQNQDAGCRHLVNSVPQFAAIAISASSDGRFAALQTS